MASSMSSSPEQPPTHPASAWDTIGFLLSLVNLVVVLPLTYLVFRSTLRAPSATPFGFHLAPVTRMALCALFLSSTAAMVFGWPHTLSLSSVSSMHVTSLLLFLSYQFYFPSLSSLVCASLLLYRLRQMERAYGARKYLGHWIAVCGVSSLLSLALLVTGRGGLVQGIACGPYAMVLGTMVLYRSEVPTHSHHRVLGLGFEVSDKALGYLLALQLVLHSAPESLFASLSALLAGVLYEQDMLGLRRSLPPSLPLSLSRLLGRGRRGREGGREVGREGGEHGLGGAGGWRQRRLMEQEREREGGGEGGREHELVPMNPNAVVGQRAALLANMMRLHPEEARRRENAPPDLEAGFAPPSEAAVAQLTAMGFTPQQSVTALMRHGGNVQLATNSLLQ